jgi:RNA polymerase sigma factor (sigma-70 family)
VEGRPPEDGELVRLARDGDDGAYARLIERHRDVVFRSAYLVVRDAAEAEDAAQEAFVKAYHALGRFRIGEPFRPWILRIAANEARNRLRGRGRRERLALRLVELGGAGDAAPSPDAAVLASEARRELLTALDALPDRERAVLIHRYLLDLTVEETARVLGLRQGTVKSRTSRGLERLRRSFGAMGRDVVMGHG